MFVIRPSLLKIFLAGIGSVFVSFLLTLKIMDYCWERYEGQNIELEVCYFEGVGWFVWSPFAVIFFFSLLTSSIQKNHCRSCGSVVPTKEIKKTLKRKITAFSESTQAVTSLNPVLGVGSGGQGASIGIGAMQSTSHIPVKLASYISTVKCPECGDKYSWINNGKVRIWTSVEGVETVEDLEEVFYPFKMVK